MAEIQQKGGEKGKGKQKKMNIHIDFTPMVDMNMLLITFFMLCTSLSKPQTMEISMPSNDKVTEAEQNKVKASQAITILLGGDNRVYYYLGEPNYHDFASLKETSYNPDGLRALLIERNQNVVQQVSDLKQQKIDKKLTEDEYKEQLATIKNDKNSPVVIIKATDDSNYKNLVDALDEMLICSISKYAIVDIADGDNFLIKNLETQGQLTANIDHSKAKK